MYFRLNPECYFVRGEKCGAIFDLITMKIYALTPQETKILTSCEKNNQVLEGLNFLNELKKLCLGNFYKHKTYIQKLRIGAINEESEVIVPLGFYRAFLEINNSCNRDCWFCGFYGIKRSLGCMGCNKWNENDESLTLERWKELIVELKDLDCQSIWINGGDLTLEWDKTMDILDYADGKFINIIITIHQQSLSEEIVKDLEKKANLVIQTEFENIPEFNRIYSEDFNYLVVVKPENWKDSNEIASGNIIKDFVIEEKKDLENLPTRVKQNFLPVTLDEFLNNVEYHPCLGHSLSIGYNGNVSPCPIMRHYKFGNVKDKGLYTIFKESMVDMGRFWKLNLDEIKKCTSCEFRYACTDCRALEESLTGGLTDKMLCNYNPQEGTWL
ncbi:MAG: SPASM domain-containing protein [Euryarchaeota archaeon]|nr:SPASM domain-containing protein [Euryarchaeota archaeon]